MRDVFELKKSIVKNWHRRELKKELVVLRRMIGKAEESFLQMLFNEKMLAKWGYDELYRFHLKWFEMEVNEVQEKYTTRFVHINADYFEKKYKPLEKLSRRGIGVKITKC